MIYLITPADNFADLARSTMWTEVVQLAVVMARDRPPFVVCTCFEHISSVGDCRGNASGHLTFIDFN